MTIQTLASTASAFLKRDIEKGILIPADNAPEWFDEMCRLAHGDHMPDDWRYEFISDALDALSECDEPDDCEPDVDSLYPYTRDRLDWLSSSLLRPGYCDAAMEEFGAEFTTTDNLIAMGMTYELREVFASVREYLADMAEEMADAE